MKPKNLIAAILGTLPLMAFATTVTIEQPDLYDITAGRSSWKIFIDGPINRESPAQVQKALEMSGDNGAVVYFNSPGGNLLSGIEIGRLIRSHSASTILGQRKPGISLVQPAECHSACSLAFLGGLYRFSIEGSVYGVHRFSSIAGPSDSDLDTAQILSAAVSTYIREMGVDPQLFDLMASTAKDEIYVVSPQKMRGLRVVNDGRQPAEWTIEANGGIQYLKGSQETQHGLAKALFVCANRGFLFHSIYDAGVKSERIAQGGWHHSLMINGKAQPIAPDKLQVVNGQLNSTFQISWLNAVAISQAESVGHAMQISPDAPTFIGYQIEIDGRSRQKVQGFMEACRPATE